MTGRGAGWCAGYDRPGYANAHTRFGLDLGYRCGGRGWRNMYYATGLPRWARPEFAPPAPTAEQELADLKVQASRPAESLDVIQKRIEEIAGCSSGPAGSEAR